METAIARLDICVWVDCPHCEHMLNLMNEDDTGGYDHNEEGAVLTQACPDGSWHEKHDNFEVCNVECSNCRNSFNVKKLEW